MIHSSYIYQNRTDQAIVQLMEQGLNASLYWDNDDLAHTVSLVPTSAITGEGVPDLLRMVITLTQEKLQVNSITFKIKFISDSFAMLVNPPKK